MSTRPLACWYHADTGTLLRVTRGGYWLELFRDDGVRARHRCDRVSFSPLGTVLSSDGARTHWLLDLAAPLTPRPLELPRGPAAVLHPDGRTLYRVSAAGLSRAALEAPAEWRPFASFAGFAARRIDPKTAGPGQEAPLPPTALDLAELTFADDGLTWVALAAGAAAIGRGDTTHAVVHTADSVAFHRRTPAFDLQRGRVLLPGAHGLLALTIDGMVAAAYGAHPVSGVAHGGGELLAVVGTLAPRYPHYVGRFTVLRLDPDTLAARGPLPGLPDHRDTDEVHGLVALPGGGVVLVPPDGPPLFAGVPDAPAVPHPEAPWYDRRVGSDGDLPLDALDAASPDQRRSLARFLLEVLPRGFDPRFQFLVDHDAAVFAPYREGVLAWDDDRLRRLEEAALHHGWFHVARGAPDTAADALAERIGHTDDPEARTRLLELLIGIDSTHALDLVGRLARGDERLARAAHDRCLHVPARGQAQRRFVGSAREVIARAQDAPAPPAAALSALAPPEDALVRTRGRTCRMAPLDVLTIDLDAFPIDALASSPLRVQRFFLSACEDCDEWQQRYLCAPAGDGSRRVSIVGAVDDSQEEDDDEDANDEDDVCDGQEPDDLDRPAFFVEDPRATRPPGERVAAVLGGRPDWLQSPEPPDCPRCRRLMFYVGSTHPSHWLGVVPDSRLFGFHCERCGLSAQIEQCT